MRISMGALQEFVPGHFTVPEDVVGRGMAGLRDFVPGHFTVPEDVVGRGMAGLMDFVPGHFTVPEDVVGRGMGDLTPTLPMYPIALNSVYSGAKTMGLAGCGGSTDDCGCGCSGGGKGMGDISSMFSDLTSGVANMDPASLAVVGGIVVATYLVFFSRPGRSGSEYSEAKKRARAKYRESVKDLQDQFPTVARRARRAAGAF